MTPYEGLIIFCLGIALLASAIGAWTKRREHSADQPRRDYGASKSPVTKRGAFPPRETAPRTRQMRQTMDTYRRLLVLAAVSLGAAVPAYPQSRGYAGGAVSFTTETQAATPERLGGTTWSGSVVVGLQVSPRLSVEFEPSFGGEVSAEEYSYRPSTSLLAEVVSRGRDTFFTFQLRGKAGLLEPIAGMSYVRSRIRRHAALVPGGRTYFDDEWSHDTVAFVGGIDAAFSVSPRFAIVPAFRVFIVPRDSPPLSNPVSGGSVVMRTGVGARATF